MLVFHQRTHYKIMMIINWHNLQTRTSSLICWDVNFKRWCTWSSLLNFIPAASADVSHSICGIEEKVVFKNSDAVWRFFRIKTKKIQATDLEQLFTSDVICCRKPKAISIICFAVTEMTLSVIFTVFQISYISRSLAIDEKAKTESDYNKDGKYQGL